MCCVLQINEQQCNKGSLTTGGCACSVQCMQYGVGTRDSLDGRDVRRLCWFEERTRTSLVITELELINSLSSGRARRARNGLLAGLTLLILRHRGRSRRLHSKHSNSVQDALRCCTAL
jgi:hypothetical protein